MKQILTAEARYPERIVCMTEETTEWFYLLEEQHRVVGISGYTVRPPEARKEKPKISAFTSAKIDKIMALEPDLVIGFSDMQADIAAELIRLGVSVFICNQRSVQQIFDTLLQLGCLVGAEAKARAILQQYASRLADIQRLAGDFPSRPTVYFEEWGDPLISGIRWVSELIDIAGGDDCFAHLAAFPDATSRIIDDANAVVACNPDIIIGSWCGRKFASSQVAARPGWSTISAVKTGELHEIKSSDILQPGPAALTDGIDQLQGIISEWASKQ
jgi:iron complex transport system substrate-binding protein